MTKKYSVEWARHHIRASKRHAFELHVVNILSNDSDACITLISPNKESASKTVQGIVNKIKSVHRKEE